VDQNDRAAWIGEEDESWTVREAPEIAGSLTA
jgi:hypothetical protein